jgi:3-hydroxymyristoyl/3-hydroxydecanoyl-(acyl carrier protein) dehydratase
MKFRMVDKIVSWQPRQAIRGVKAVSLEEYCLKAPFGGPPALPESLLLEALFQLGNWLVMLSTDFQQMGMIVRVGEVRFDDRLRPGQRLDMFVTARSFRDDGVLLDGQAAVGGRPIAYGVGCLAVPVPLADYADPADLRVLYSQIHRPAPAEEGPDEPA